MHVIFRRYLPFIPPGPEEFFDGIVDEGGCFIVSEDEEYIVSQSMDFTTFTLQSTRSFDTSASGFLAEETIVLNELAFVRIDWGDGSFVLQKKQEGNTEKTYTHTYNSSGVFEIKVYISG